MIQPISAATQSHNTTHTSVKLQNPMIMQAAMLSQLDALLAQMQDSLMSGQDAVHKQRVRREQEEIENRYDYSANTHLTSGAFIFACSIAAAFAHTKSEAIGQFLNQLANQGDRGAKFLLEPNQAGIARYQLLQQLDQKDASTCQQNASLIQQIYDNKKSLEKTLIELSASTMRVQV
jgi:hypothetical protein